MKKKNTTLVLDVVEALTGSERARKYWNDLKIKLKHEGSQLSEKVGQLKMKSQKDGKNYLTDVLDMKGILRLIESVPSPKAEPFKLWLASLGDERINEVFDPKIAINRAVEYYRKRGYDDKWIKARLAGLVDRFKLTDVQNREIAKRGGNIAKITCDNLEKELGRSVVTNHNSLSYQYIDEVKQIENEVD